MSTSTTCGTCHSIGTVWTPATMNHTGAVLCSTCHSYTTDLNGWMKGELLPGHISITGQQCGACHSTTLANWLGATYSHPGVTAATDCYTGCHNGTNVVTTLPTGAKAHTYAPMNDTTHKCGACHTWGTAWTPATMNHTGATTCTNCHSYSANANGWTAGSPKANHIPTTSYPLCSSCHSTTVWKPSTFAHTGVVAGSCATCHNGTGATGPDGNHPASTLGTGATYKCDACHRTTAWLPPTFLHTGVTTGCAGCHKTGFATAPSTTHFITTKVCETCHSSTTAWAPIKSYSHISPYYKAHPSLSMTTYADCKLCHIGNNETISGAPHKGSAAYKPYCAWCHSTQFKSGSHKKTSSPSTINYAITDTNPNIWDCSGACHEYTNNTFTTIKTSKTGHHKSSSSGF
jgi:hypothetical protein